MMVTLEQYPGDLALCCARCDGVRRKTLGELH